MADVDPALVQVGYEALQPHLPDEPGWSVVVMVKAVLRAVTPTIREQKMAAADIAFLDAVAARERLEMGWGADDAR